MQFTIPAARPVMPRPARDCGHPRCTGVHDNNRYRELCPRSLDLKRAKDCEYKRKILGWYEPGGMATDEAMSRLASFVAERNSVA